MGRTKKQVDSELVEAVITKELEKRHYHSKEELRELLIVAAFGGLIARGAGTNVDALCASAINMADAMMERL